VSRVSGAPAVRYSGWQGQGKDAYHEILLAREVSVDKAGSYQVNYAGEQNQANRFYIAQAKALNNTGLRVIT